MNGIIPLKSRYLGSLKGRCHHPRSEYQEVYKNHRPTIPPKDTCHGQFHAPFVLFTTKLAQNRGKKVFMGVCRKSSEQFEISRFGRRNVNNEISWPCNSRRCRSSGRTHGSSDINAITSRAGSKILGAFQLVQVPTGCEGSVAARSCFNQARKHDLMSLSGSSH